MSGRNLAPALIAAGVGVLGGIYIWKAPLEEISGKTPAPSAPTDGRGQSAKDVQDKGTASVSPTHH
ncbi:hypothetical protein EHS25_006506 [Saitozyma podzolica]|uniref:Uncharacterized protein n=1 Tax=Saitozyma podzolica TaxID=1890683 RepID=A0A427YS08_9TREE|nr:hypothetical protein EHS25_006506 [Saitozyma podzolica]